MKCAIRTIAMAGLLLFAQACSKDDDDKIRIQAHGQNEMMKIMHANMDEMMAMQMPNDPDNAFAMMMKVHHQGAINMGNKELQSGDDATMKDMAQKIITDQTAEIQQLTDFLNSHPAHENVPEFITEQMKGMERSSKIIDLQIVNGDIDHDFAMLMIFHHQSAIENARLELIYGVEPAMKAMAKNMIDKQDKEIKDLQAWLISDGK
jgi:uncharacterized protein (DUF305 family)